MVVVNPILDLSLAPTAASPTINTQQVLTATVVDSANSNAPKAGVTVTFTISGTAAQVSVERRMKRQWRCRHQACSADMSPRSWDLPWLEQVHGWG